MLQIIKNARKIQALDRCHVRSDQPGQLVIRDGQGRVYHRAAIDGEACFTVSGALGSQLLCLEDEEGRILDSCSIQADAATGIVSEDQPELAEFMRMLRWNINKGREFRVVREGGETRFLFSDWLRDHVHILKGKKYLHAAVKDAIDLYAKHQRDDGMLFDFYVPHRPGSVGFVNRFRLPGWVKLWEDETMVFQRVPVENDVEFLFVLGVYQTWQASGDDAWLHDKLESCTRALRYACHDELRWSSKHGLLKRGFTLDTWDFLSQADSARVGDNMDIHPDDTDFCIFHGDNTGFACSCRLLAEMLEHCGRAGEAAPWLERGQEVMSRLDALAWQGGHYTHQIPEEPGTEQEFGVDPGEQVSLSNAYALGRDISQEQARAILATYRRIREELPAETEGEFISLYPPFHKGWKIRAGEYVNGGIFPFIGGELAAGAFRHGESSYGADLLTRLRQLLERSNGDYPYYFYADLAKRDPGDLRVIDITSQCNCGFGGDGTHVPQWTGEGRSNDFSLAQAGEHDVHGIPCRVIDAQENKGASCIGLHPSTPYASQSEIPLNGTAGAIYIHHTAAGGTDPFGWVDLCYADNSNERIFVKAGVNIANWWDPQDCQGPSGRPYTGYHLRTAIVGDNARTRVGSYLWGLDNPHPEKELAAIRFCHSGLSAHWFILGITLGSGPRWLGTRSCREGWLENWNAAAVLHALIEGQAGIHDDGRRFDRVTISPRWVAAGTKHAKVCAHYPASNAYCAYEYRQGYDGLDLTVAGEGSQRQISVLLPEGFSPAEVTVDGIEQAFSLRKHGEDHYCDLQVEGLKAQTITIR